MKKEVKNKLKIKKWVLILIIVVAVLLIISVIIYFLFVNQGKTFLGFKLPNFSPAIGETIGKLLNANVWQDIKLNPFGE